MMSKIGLALLVLIILFGLSFVAGNMIKVPYTAMVSYTERVPYEEEVCEEDCIYCKRVCLKPGKPIATGSEGMMTVIFYGCGEWGKVNCTDKPEMGVAYGTNISETGINGVMECENVCSNVTRERILPYRKQETFYKSLFEVLGLDVLVWKKSI